MAECWFQGKTQETSVDKFFATPSPTVQSMGQDRMQNGMHLVMGLFFFLLFWAHCNKDLHKGYMLSYNLCIQLPWKPGEAVPLSEHHQLLTHYTPE